MERNDSLTAKSWLSAGWVTFKTYPEKLILGSLIVSAPYFLFSLLSGAGGAAKHPVGLFAAGLALLLIGPTLYIGWCYFCLRLTRGVDVPFGAIFDAFRRWGTTWFLLVAVTVVSALGYIALVIPGIILWLRYWLSLFAVMDKQVNGSDAMSLSVKITRGYKWPLFALYIITLIPLILDYGVGFLASRIESQLLHLKPLITLLASCVISPWVTSSVAVAYDRCSAAYAERELAGPDSSEGITIAPDVERDILSGQLSKRDIMIKYAIRAEELEAMYRKLAVKE